MKWFSRSQLASMKQSLPAAGKPIASISQRLDRYLDQPVNLGFLSHPAVRWGLTAVLTLYLIVGIVVGWKVYKVKAESANVRRILTVYPLPAVLMPQDIILVRDYLHKLKFIRHFAEKTKKPLPPDNELRAQLIDTMIETQLLLHATKQYNARVTKSDIDAAYKKVADSNGGPQEIQKLLTDLYNMKESEFRALIRDELLRDKVRQEVLVQVHAQHILMSDEKKAKEVLEQLKKEPNKFEELAKQQSQDTATREKGGDLGFINRGIMAPAFEEVAFKLKKGEMTQELVKSDFGYHIIRVVERKGKVDKSYKDFLDDLRKDKKIWILVK